jgi:hypothetical protein
MATQEQLSKFKCEKPVSRWVSLEGSEAYKVGFTGDDLVRTIDQVEAIEDCGICAGCLSRLVIKMVEGIDGESIHE